MIPIDYTEFNLISKRDGIVFVLDEHTPEMVLSTHDYDYTGITKDSVVLDIGANCGAFALHAAKLCKLVVAVEPLLFDQMRENVRASDLSNVAVIRGALGNGSVSKVSWGDQTSEVSTYSLSYFKSLCLGYVNFLKCDCEGFEWYIQPDELEGINRLEMELHYFKEDGYPKSNPKLVEYIMTHYDVVIDPQDNLEAVVIHATRKGIYTEQKNTVNNAKTIEILR
jgi:FkbM family methyltransferase